MDETSILECLYSVGLYKTERRPNPHLQQNIFFREIQGPNSWKTRWTGQLILSQYIAQIIKLSFSEPFPPNTLFSLSLPIFAKHWCVTAGQGEWVKEPWDGWFQPHAILWLHNRLQSLNFYLTYHLLFNVCVCVYI